ncbi:glutathione S-transferase family protein [Thalassobaculum sp. OXR-137]|uniref:glutathione S-transferase family protein n=1 Tax=Thalassobaculum sp. OXR-137 TaxID=3100173 RepID=UPI002AC92D82|nr:glutathione S-transferase family protein [Thalassobaculum sp. OXR-137]WPZ36429.1 glutathione S-transferase family protein [Thalassobaculum sp. OXR-137]
MGDLILTTFDWVPEPPRGFVRDLRVRWALEEAGLSYRVATVPFEDRRPEHFAHQPFGQVPWLTDGQLSIFETGAILLHLGGLSDTLLPNDPDARSTTVQWVFAALNSVEAAVQPWILYKFTGDTTQTPGRQLMDTFIAGRLKHMETVLGDREWLGRSFSVADILMADVLRVTDMFDGLAEHPVCRAYVARATTRPSFIKAHGDQLAHFAAADAARAR